MLGLGGYDYCVRDKRRSTVISAERAKVRVHVELHVSVPTITLSIQDTDTKGMYKQFFGPVAFVITQEGAFSMVVRNGRLTWLERLEALPCNWN